MLKREGTCGMEDTTLADTGEGMVWDRGGKHCRTFRLYRYLCCVHIEDTLKCPGGIL